MKTCRVCGQRFEDAYLYCWEDGTRLDIGSSLPVVDGTPGVPNQPGLTIPREALVKAQPELEFQSTRGMYCQGCHRTYPLTFTFCPVDFLPLTQKIEQTDNSVSDPEPVEAFSSANNIETRADEEMRRIDSEPETKTAGIEVSQSEPGLSPPEESSFLFTEQARRLWLGGSAFQSFERKRPITVRDDNSTDNTVTGGDSKMRVAARATAAALVLFTVGALYVIYSYATRGPSRSTPIAPTSKYDSSPADRPLIATPREARDYVEEQPEPALAKASDSSSIEPAYPEPQRATSRSRTDAERYRPMPDSVRPRSIATETAFPSAGRFASELVRIRSRRSASGYWYELTFTIRENAGRPMRWERLSIFTRSTSGATHSESMPFPYLLSGSGALTFTINVQMPGKSESDWSGRISLMSVGADESGRPLRASLAANVAP
jgi:hypothetical protein